MPRVSSARSRRSNERLSAGAIRSICSRIFPKRNDYVDDLNYVAELVEELAQVGVNTRGELKRLLTHHRRTLMRMDRAPLDAVETAIYSEMVGEREIADFKRRQYFYAFPAFVRNAIELEFGISVQEVEGESIS